MLPIKTKCCVDHLSRQPIADIFRFGFGPSYVELKSALPSASAGGNWENQTV